MPLRADDADDLAELAGLLESEGVAGLRERFRGWESGRSPDGTAEWLNWVVRLRGPRAVAVGWVQATVARGRAEIAYATLMGQRRRGYAVEAVGAVVEWLRESHAVSSVEAHVDPLNTASSALAAAVGLRRAEELDDGEVVWRS